jgi:3-deoxy-manno-octulosonate cytidylyltransferase (CMP-KDO synthetase)
VTGRAIAVIPARLESTRLPRKALVDICGMPMIAHVLLRCQRAARLDAVYVATDSVEIRDVVQRYGGEALMTSPRHETGTDRIAEAVEAIDCEIVVNVQGDEALVKPEHVDAAVEALSRDPALDVALLVNPYFKTDVPSDIKAVVDEQDYVLYLSRADIPSAARTPERPMLKAYHVVAFRKPFLLAYARWPRGTLETIEYNEYLRILEKGHRIRAVHVASSAVSVDTVADLRFVRGEMEKDGLFRSYGMAPGAGAVG